MIPTASNYPDSLDSDTNLFIVHDALRMMLADDYNVGDTSITVTGDSIVMSRFPDTGIITLTDQCDTIDKRAISFYYGSKTDYTFDSLELLPGYEDVSKPRNFTHVTLNVMSQHHNNLKDALIATEEFVGVKGTIDTVPYGDTIEGRVNFLRKLVYTPRAWFKVVGNTVGLVPLEVTFLDETTRTGPGDVTYLWDFGDQTCSVISVISVISVDYPTISVTDVVPINEQQVLVEDLDGGQITKTYTCPGKFTVKLTVTNEYGTDTVQFDELINARVEAPDEAVIDFVPNASQLVTSGEPTGGPYTTPPTIRSAVDTFVDVEVQQGVNPVTGKTYGGETVNNLGVSIDPITTYTWSMGDELSHETLSSTRALYSVGGMYDLKLRVDTTYGAYRITTYKDAINIIENKNLWMWTFTGLYEPPETASYLDYLQLSGYVKANEFGLVSETFKTANTELLVYRDDSFLESAEWQTLGTDVINQAKKEFRRNIGFVPRGTTSSGEGGTCVLFYAQGGTVSSPLTEQSVRVVEYNAFSDSYTLGHTSIVRPWNWVNLSGSTNSYFVMGQNPTHLPGTNPSYQVKTQYNLETMTSTNTSLTIDNYKNGAHELMQHVSYYDPATGDPTNGWFAVYRSAWKNNTGFFIRNDGVNAFFRLKSFYKTENTVGDSFVNIKKLVDVDGPTKLEGELVSLTNGVFLFNNTGKISAYNDSTGVWETGGPSGDSVAFGSVQDKSVIGFNNEGNTLLATSDNDYTAYLSYDYSNNAFIKFNGHDLTYSSLGARPTGSQFMLGLY